MGRCEDLTHYYLQVVHNFIIFFFFKSICNKMEAPSLKCEKTKLSTKSYLPDAVTNLNQFSLKE